jgi:pimeloyl-ACP methyl ester carboxylesterase
MSYSQASNTQKTLARRSFLRLMAGTSLGMTLLAACQPITRPAEPAVAGNAQGEGDLKLQNVTVNGVELHYVEQGQGDPVVFLHDGLNDYRRWLPQLERFAPHYRVIAYSQRYYYPNQNLPIVDNYTTLVDAQDLVAFLQALKLERSNIVGYSSGAFMALAMALEHPELVRSLVLAEPPILHWLPDLPGGNAVYAEFMSTLWEPVGDAFRAGDQELALRKSLEFFIGADVLDELPAEVHQPLEENLGGWEAFTTSSECFPMLDKAQVANLPMPVLLLTAENTLAVHQLVNAELVRLLPQAQHVHIRDATHEMWSEQPEACGEAVLEFLLARA